MDGVREMPDSPTPARQPSPIVISEDERGSPPVMLVDVDDDPEDFAVIPDADDYFLTFPYARSGHYSSMVRDLTQHIKTCEYLFCMF